MVFNVTLNNISVYILAVSFNGGEHCSTWENHRPDASHWQTWSHNVVLITPTMREIAPYDHDNDSPTDQILLL